MTLITLTFAVLWGVRDWQDDKHKTTDLTGEKRFKALSDKVDALQIALNLKGL